MRRNPTGTLRTGHNGGFAPGVTSASALDPAEVKAAAAVATVAGCRVLGIDPRDPANRAQVTAIREELAAMLGEGTHREP